MTENERNRLRAQLNEIQRKQLDPAVNDALRQEILELNKQLRFEKEANRIANAELDYARDQITDALKALEHQVQSGGQEGTRIAIKIFRERKVPDAAPPITCSKCRAVKDICYLCPNCIEPPRVKAQTSDECPHGYASADDCLYGCYDAREERSIELYREDARSKDEYWKKPEAPQPRIWALCEKCGASLEFKSRRKRGNEGKCMKCHHQNSIIYIDSGRMCPGCHLISNICRCSS